MTRGADRLDVHVLGRIITGRLRSRKITAAVAAGEIGTSGATLSRVLSGDCPDLNTYILLCEWLDVSLDTFIVARGRAPAGADDYVAWQNAGSGTRGQRHG